MDNTFQENKNMTYYLSDIHGVYSPIYSVLTYTTPGDSIVQLGDGLAVGFLEPQSDFYNVTQLNKRLAAAGVTYYQALGNHEVRAPHESGIHGGYDFGKFSHVKFVKDFSVLNIGGKRTGFIGGAVSVDRSYRKAGRDYWLDEKVVDSEEYKNLVDLDVLISHTTPTYFSPFKDDTTNIRGFLQRDLLLAQDLREESALMAKYYNWVFESSPRLSHILYGHFHYNYEMEHNGVIVKCLDVNETYFI